MATEESTTRPRRAVLAAGVGTLGGIVAGRLMSPGPAAAADGGNLVLGQSNEATNLTSLGVSGNNIAFQVAGNTTEANLVEFSNAGAGAGLSSQSWDGWGSIAITVNGAWGAGGVSSVGGIGVAGGSSASTAEMAPVYVAQTGVFGVGKVTATSNSTGVWGEGDVGVYGYGYYGVWGEGFNGLRGQADPTVGAIGVVAAAPSTSQYALVATGKVKLSRSGKTSFAVNTKSRKVTLTGVTTSTHVLAQLSTNRYGYYVQSVVPASGSFTIYLNKAVPGTTYVHWVVLDA